VKNFRTKETRVQIVGLITSVSCSIARYNNENEINYYNLNQQKHTIVLDLQKYYKKN